jgi:hypothetical protein
MIKYFLEGYGSILKIFSSTNESSDCENLKNDWWQVGDYIENAITHCKKEGNSYVEKLTEAAGTRKERRK